MIPQDAEGWDAHRPCPLCPHEPYVLHSQKWLHPGPKTYTKVREPWNDAEWKAAHPGMRAGERALRWLSDTFSGHR